MSDDEKALDPRTKGILAATIVLYAAGIAFLAATGQFTFVTKTVVVPALFLVAALTRRLKPFILEWSVFLSIVVLFDSLRGYAHYLTTSLDGDVYMGYVITFDRWLFGGEVGSVALQRLLNTGDQTRLFDQILTVAHGSHFLVFLLIGFAVWYTRRERFGRFKLGMSLVIVLGVIGYALVPTVPPWMASEEFHVIPPITRVFGEQYNVAMPALSEAFDVNPIAAMPSLHTAFPVFLALAAVATWGRRGLLVVPYALVVMFALVYGGEHYVADIVAGLALAVLSFAIAYRTPLLARWEAFVAAQIAASGSAAFRVLNTDVRRRLALTALLLGLAELTGQVAAANGTGWTPDARFAARELVGRSDLAHYYIGSAAYSAKDFATAARELERAAAEARDGKHKRRAGVFFARAALFAGDYRRAVDAFAALPFAEIARKDGPLIAMAQVRAGRIDDGLATLARLERAFPCRAEYVFWRAALGYLTGRSDAAALVADVAALRARIDDDDAARYAALLAELAAAKPGEATRAGLKVRSFFGVGG